MARAKDDIFCMVSITLSWAHSDGGAAHAAFLRVGEPQGYRLHAGVCPSLPPRSQAEALAMAEEFIRRLFLDPRGVPQYPKDAHR